MTNEDMVQDDMDEPHPYQGPMPWKSFANFEKDPYPLGNLNFKPEVIQRIDGAGVPQLINEYGWVWLWRNGTPSKLTLLTYKYYLGSESTPDQNREFQAYWMELETEWLRSNPNPAGVLAFCYLANNYGYTGDWFIGNIKDLKPSPTLDWFRHAFAPAATYINLTDERYLKNSQPHEPGSTLLFNLTGINNLTAPVNGSVKIRLVNQEGKSFAEQNFPVNLNSFVRTDIPVSILMPAQSGGYILVAEFTPENGNPVISRRFLKIGKATDYSFYQLNPAGK